MKKTFGVLLAALCMLFLPVFAYANEDDVTEGTLKIVGRPQLSVCPLKHTSVDAKLSGFIGRVTVQQTFVNPSKETIEAVYIFPLPNRAAVDSMTMKIGDRIIKANIKTREDAKRIYEEAKTQGQRAALLEQERPNIFTQSVANIMPNDKIEITISYVEQLSYQDGVYEFAFPMVVGPRFIPGNAKGFFGGDDSIVRNEKPVSRPNPNDNNRCIPYPGRTQKQPVPSEQSGTGWATDTNVVPDASRITPIVTPPGTRAGHDISLKVSIESPVGLEKIESILHRVDINKTGNNAVIKLRSDDSIPNKDFILKYTTAGKKVEEGLLYHTSVKNGGFFSLVVQPPNRPSNNEITPKEMIFVIDTSGSQMGDPIEKAKETIIHCMDNMNADDTFNLLDFSNQTIKLFDNPVANTRENRQKAKDFLRNQLGGGGTHMLPAVLESLQLKEDPRRLRIVCFMTDGYVGNDMQIIDSIAKNIGHSRLFSFGTGNSVNRYLIDKMAEVGKGEAEHVTLNRSGAEVAEAFQRKIGTPIMTDISIDWNGLPVSEVFPQNHPDLFSGKPLIFTGRFSKEAQGELLLKGYIAKQPFTKKIKVDFPKQEKSNDVLASLWARTKIESLMDKDLQGIQSRNTNADVKSQIVNLGLNYNLVTQFTSFVAVEEKIVNKDGKITTIAVPVEMPDGVKHEGIFGTKGDVQHEYAAPGASTRSYNANVSVGPAVGHAPPPSSYWGSGSTTKSKSSHESYSSDVSIDASRQANSAPRSYAPSHNKMTSKVYYKDESYVNKSFNANSRDKLDEVLTALASGNSSKYEKDFVKNGNVNVCVKLNYMSNELLGRMKSLGLTVKNYSVSQKIVVGSIAVSSLEALANDGSVKKIEIFNDNVSGKTGIRVEKTSIVASSIYKVKVFSNNFLAFLFPSFFVGLKD